MTKCLLHVKHSASVETKVYKDQRSSGTYILVGVNEGHACVCVVKCTEVTSVVCDSFQPHRV